MHHKKDGARTDKQKGSKKNPDLDNQTLMLAARCSHREPDHQSLKAFWNQNNNMTHVRTTDQ
jgi:hypothetical protein